MQLSKDQEVFGELVHPLRMTSYRNRMYWGQCWLRNLAVAFSIASLLLLAAILLRNTRLSHWFSGQAIYVETAAVGEVTVGDVIEIKASITAIHNDVRIVGAKVPCSCIGISPIPLSVPAGATREVRIRFDTSNRKAGVFRGEIPLLLNVKSSQVVIPFQLKLNTGQTKTP